ncbi:baeRF11 domain-containing protein [Rathayibacter soli]|uniref:baeRF11 domain-containing protein n=1 Tax=Rathayibacter soli TaxID=3144168 RepID=UPI0027E3DBB1|nr:hypothetical protein [Glaciibacter superstes]
MMSVQYELPDAEDFLRLAQRRDHSITVYAATSPVVGRREASFTAVKSAFDDAIERVAASGASHALRTALHGQWSRIAADQQLWGNLASSLALFVAEDFSEVFVLPNRLENQLQVAEYFDIGQLLRSVTFPQEAYAVLLSANEWSLWFATAEARAAKVEVAAAHPANLDEATNRDPIPERERQGRLIGDEGRKTLMDTYAKRVSDAVAKELAERDPRESDVVFIFANEPLLSMFQSRGVRERVLLPVSGAPDRLTAAEIDKVMRDRLSEWNARTAQDEVDAIANDSGNGLAATELSTIARAAVSGAVRTLVFAFSVDVNGTFDDASGAIEFAPDNGTRMPSGEPAYDVLSRIAVSVLARGGSVVAVRPDEVASAAWDGTAIARLRFPLG